MIRVVAIDGPSGSGKSTVARGVAAALGLDVLDTGAMYRAVTLLGARARPRPRRRRRHRARRPSRHSSSSATRRGSVRLDGRDVDREIRGPEVTAAVSAVSAAPGGRAALVGARQRAWAERHGGGVVEGRDIGTVVFPDAPLKVFLTASGRRAGAPAPARRGGRRAPRRPESVRDAVDAARHARLDRTRRLAPPPDAVVIDTTGRDVDDVVAEIVERYEAAVGAEP